MAVEMHFQYSFEEMKIQILRLTGCLFLEAFSPQLPIDLNSDEKLVVLHNDYCFASDQGMC